MRNALALIPILFLVSCIGTEERLRSAQTDYEIYFDEAIEEYNEGLITEDELDERLAELTEERDDEMEDAIQDQLDAVVEAPKQVIGALTGNTWIDLLLGAAGIAEGARRYTNFDRDRKRKKRGEPTGESAAS